MSLTTDFLADNIYINNERIRFLQRINSINARNICAGSLLLLFLATGLTFADDKGSISNQPKTGLSDIYTSIDASEMDTLLWLSSRKNMNLLCRGLAASYVDIYHDRVRFAVLIAEKGPSPAILKKVTPEALEKAGKVYFEAECPSGPLLGLMSFRRSVEILVIGRLREFVNANS